VLRNEPAAETEPQKVKCGGMLGGGGLYHIILDTHRKRVKEGRKEGRKHIIQKPILFFV
jgi:hypothetical protein